MGKMLIQKGIFYTVFSISGLLLGCCETCGKPRGKAVYCSIECFEKDISAAQQDIFLPLHYNSLGHESGIYNVIEN